MEKFSLKHFVITRFLAFDFQNTHLIENKEYIEFCFEKLQTNFIATLNNQTNKNFEIIILTSKMFFDLVKQRLPKSNNKITVILFDENYKELNDFLKQYKCYNHIITTNLDYDDFLLNTAIERIQKACCENTTFKLFGFQNGVTMDDKFNCYRFIRTWNGKLGLMSQGLSLICKSDNLYNLYDLGKLGDHTLYKIVIEKNKKHFNLEKLDDDFFDFDKKDCYFIWYRHSFSGTTVTRKIIHTSNEKVQIKFENYGIKEL